MYVIYKPRLKINSLFFSFLRDSPIVIITVFDVQTFQFYTRTRCVTIIVLRMNILLYRKKRKRCTHCRFLMCIIIIYRVWIVITIEMLSLTFPNQQSFRCIFILHNIIYTIFVIWKKNLLNDFHPHWTPHRNPPHRYFPSGSHPSNPSFFPWTLCPSHQTPLCLSRAGIRYLGRIRWRRAREFIRPLKLTFITNIRNVSKVPFVNVALEPWLFVQQRLLIFILYAVSLKNGCNRTISCGTRSWFSLVF